MSKRTFHLGRMDKDTDERLLPNGVYRHAENIDVINSEGSDVGAVENSLSNKQLTYFDIGANVYDLGKFEDKKNSKLYWFTLSDNGAFLFEWDDFNQVQSVVLADTRPEATRVLKLDKDKMITGICKIYSQDGENDLLLSTDDNIDPLCINIERAKGYGENGFEKEDIYLIKKPPAFAPTCTLIFDGTPENYIEDKFFTFAYRYRYLDGEYSAFSSFSLYQFTAKGYEVDYFECINKDMVNAFNAVNIKINTGDQRVTEIQVIAKQSNSNIPYIVETFDKEKLGWGHNQVESFNFYNNKIYKALAEKELFRLFDNVPRKAKALTEANNIPILGNYLEGYDLLDADGNEINFLHSLTYNTYSLDSEYDFTTNIDNSGYSIFEVDEPLEQVFISGYSLELNIAFEIESEEVYSNSFQFIMERDYVNFLDLFNDPDFENFISAINNDIANHYNSEGQYDIGSDMVIAEDPYISTSYTSGVASFTLHPLVLDVSMGSSAEEEIETLFLPAETTINVFRTGTGRSCKTNRNYQVDLVYKDEFKRSSTVITSLQDTVYIPQLYAENTNKLQLRIPHPVPEWAKYFSVAVKAKPLEYHNIMVTEFYQDGNYTWCLLQGDNKDKVKAGDLLIPKCVPNLMTDVQYISVLDVQYQERNFIEGNNDLNDNEIQEPSGTYMKIRPQGFSMDVGDIEVRSSGDYDQAGKNNHAKIYLSLFSEEADGGGIDDLAIPQGAFIKLWFHESRKNGGDGYVNRDYEKILYASSSYDSLGVFLQENLFNNPVRFERREEPGSYVDMTDKFSLNRGYMTEGVFGQEVFEYDPTGKQYLLLESDMDGWGGGNDVNLSGRILVRIGQGEYVFETVPKDIEQEIYFESQEFEIVNGYHLGNVQDQTDVDDAIIELDFYNCFVFGNGVESYRVRDSVNTNYLNIDTRPNATSIEPYRAIRRFADWTYGEAFIESAGINGINAFNLSTINFKEGDKQYGSIQILYTRDTDIVSIQEHKAFKVLFGKDLLMTAQGNPVVSTTPQILGQLIPYQGDNGIGLHPESFAVDAYRIYYFCPDSNTPIRLSLDGTEEINSGLVDWFRDLTMESYGSRKLGGYDPYKKMYVMHSETPLVPVFNVSCGNVVYKKIADVFTYTFNLNSLLGDIVLQYEVIEGEVDIEVDYDGNITQELGSDSTGTITITRDDASETVAQVTITPVSDEAIIRITNLCPVGVPLEMIHIVLCDESDIGETMVDRHYWGSSQLYSKNILFETSELNSFIVENGLEGVGKFPVNGSTVTMQAFKGVLNTGSYLADFGNAMGYLVTDSDYTEDDIETILDEATWIDTTQTSLGLESTVDEGSFIFNRPSESHKLYKIWDYRNSAITENTRIIIYFDSSGSMNSTLAPLNEMRDTLLKYALLPLYNYDEYLYDNRVSVVSDSSERTFNMLNMLGATPDGNVIVMVFQDECSSYGVDGFWTDAEPMTSTGPTDLATLRSRLDSFAPNYYRGVVFAVEDDTYGATFDDFLIALRDGTGLYAGTGGLSDKPEITYRMILNDGDTPEYYLAQIIDALSDFGIDI